MSDELRGLPGENEILTGLLAPASHRFGCRCPIEHAVELGRRKLAGIVLKLVLERQSLGKERSAPGIVMPS